MQDRITDFETLQAMRRGWCFFGGSPDLPPAPPPPPTRDDPAIAEARKRVRLSEKQRRGRRGSFFFGRTPEAQLGDAPLSQPRAGAQIGKTELG